MCTVRLCNLQIKSENSFWSKDMILARKFQQNLTKRQNEGGEAATNLRYSVYILRPCIIFTRVSYERPRRK